MYDVPNTNDATASRSRRAGGFTLIEMLVVVAIIIILMAALMPLYGKVLLQSKRQAVQAMIMGLAASLERYKVVFDAYPPSPTSSGTEDDGTLYSYLNGVDGHGVVANLGTPREQRYEPFLSLNAQFYKFINNKLIVVDIWGMPIHYFNCKAYVEDQQGNPLFCHNPTSVDIYSTGQDKMKDPELIEPGTSLVKPRNETVLVDDITNF